MEAEVAPLVDIAGRMAEAGAPAQSAEMAPNTALFPVGVALSNAQSAQSRRLAQLFQLASDVVDALRDNRQTLDVAATDSVAARRQAGELVSLADTLTRVVLREAELIAQARRLLARLLPRELTEGAETGERDPLFNTPSAASATTGNLDGLGFDMGLLNTGMTSEYTALPPTDAQAAGIAPMTMPMSTLDAAASDPERKLAAFKPGELPGELVDSWSLLRQLHAAVAQEQRHAATIARDLGVLSRLVRQTDGNVVKALQTLDTAQKQAEQAQALSGGTGIDPADGSAGWQGPQNIGRRAPLPTRPLGMDTRLSDSGRLLQPDAPSSATPAPGSIRVQDLLGPDRGQRSGFLEGTQAVQGDNQDGNQDGSAQ